MTSKVFPLLVTATVSIFTIIAVTIFYTPLNMMIRIPFVSNANQLDSVHSFLAAVPYGQWIPFEPRPDALREVLSFSNYVRHELYGLPSKQRPDGTCGNTTVTSTKNANQKYRSLCSSAGPTPCCHDNHCVDRDKDQCACAQCIDERREIHADFARYVMCSSSHQLTQFTSPRSVCDVMSNVTLHVYGDSLASQVYLALLTKAVGGNMTRLFAAKTPQDEKRKCQGQRMYPKKCRRWMKEVWRFPSCEVPGEMSATYVPIKNVNKTRLKNLVRRLALTPNSVLYVGIGVNEILSASWVNSAVLQPILEAKGHSRWPYVIVAGLHHWGVLRSPTYSGVRRFNQELKSLVSQYGMTYFDTYELTRNVFSYDGTHYGQGVNQVKADILLNVIQMIKQETVQ